MLQASIIGYLGADAEIKGDSGREFITFRVSHSERYTDQAGTTHDNTVWVDVTLNGRQRIVEFLKRGTCVFVQGRLSLRVYSSAKDRCMKAGASISATTVELIGGKSDEVPSRLYDHEGVQHDVQKYYHTDMKGGVLMSTQGKQFVVDDNGWILPANDAPADVQQVVESQNT